MKIIYAVLTEVAYSSDLDCNVLRVAVTTAELSEDKEITKLTTKLIGLVEHTSVADFTIAMNKLLEELNA